MTGIEPAVRIEGVGKVYEPSPLWLRLLLKSAVDEPVVALDDMSFTVDPGQICAVVGPNGAGKSTLFRVLTGLTTPTTGRATICGLDCETQSVAVRRVIGFMPPEDRTLYLRHSCVDNLVFHGRMQGIPEHELRPRIDDTLELVGLAHAADRAGFALSSGMRARLQLARALLHRPSVLILDEPTGTVDLMAARSFLDTLQEVAASSKVAVLISSHRLEEIEALDDNMVLLDQGRLLYHGDLNVMRDVWEVPRLELTLSEAAAVGRVTDLLESHGVGVTSTDDRLIVLDTNRPPGELLQLLGQDVGCVQSLNPSRLPLRELLATIIANRDGSSEPTTVPA